MSFPIKTALLIFSASAVATFAMTPTPAQAAAPKALTLSEAVRIGLEQNPSNLSRVEAQVSSDANIAVTRGLLFPQITAQASSLQKKDPATLTTSPFNGENYNQYTASIRLTQTIFQVGSLAGIDSAKRASDLSKLDAQVSARDLTSQIIQTYFLAVLSKRNLDTLVRQQKIVRESFGVSKRRENLGLGLRTDSLQVQTQLALLDAQITNANNDYQVVIANLARLLGNRDAVSFQIKDSLEAPALNEVDQSVDLKSYQIPEIDITRLKLEQIDNLKRVRLGQHLPTLSLLGEYGYSSYKAADLFDAYTAGWYAGVQLTIPLFSGLSSIYEQRSLTSQQLQLEYQKRAVEDQITFQQVSNRKKLEAAHASILTGVEALKLATASSNEAQRIYRQSRMDFFQFFQVQQAYVLAEQSLNSYKYNYITALANYYIASGQDLPKLVQVLERTNP